MHDETSNSPANSHSSTSSPPCSQCSTNVGETKDKTAKKRARRKWTHTLEQHIFNAHEIATLGASHRRVIYQASIEGHIDRLHSQLHALSRYPIEPDALLPLKGLNCVTAKGMVAGLQNDILRNRKYVQETHKIMDDLTRDYEETIKSRHQT